MGAPASFGSPYNKTGIKTAANALAVGLYNVAGEVVTITTTSSPVAVGDTAIDDIGTKEVLNVVPSKHFFYIIPGADGALFELTQPVYTGAELTTPGTIAFKDPAVVGRYTCRIAAEDQDGLVSEQDLLILVPDVTAPSMTAFVIPGTGTSYTVTVSSITASGTPSHFKITETNVAPLAGAAGWVAAPGPATYAITTQNGTGAYSLYAWAKDAAGNVSASATDSITLTIA